METEIQSMENEKEREKIYSVWHRKIENLESQLNPILSESCTAETPPSCNVIIEKINSELEFIDKLLNAEKSNLKQEDSDNAASEHLGQMFRKVQRLKSACRAFEGSRPTSSGIESGEPPVSYFDSYDEYDVEGGEVENYGGHEEGETFDNEGGEHENENYSDHEDGENFSMVGFKKYYNPVFVDDHDDDRDGVVEDEGAGNYGECSLDQVEAETVRDDRKTEEEHISDEQVEVTELEGTVRDESVTEEEHICDEQVEVTELEGTREEETVSVRDQKGKKTEKAETSGDDAGDDSGAKTRYCYKVVFWGVFIGIGISSVIAGFFVILDYQSSDVVLTPT